MSRISAAALIFAALVLAPGGSAGPEQTALVQLTPNELRLREPLKAIDARGGRVAFAFCNQLVGVWRPGSGLTRLGPVAQWTCPPPRSLELTFSLALAGDRVAWVVHTGGNVVTNLLFMVVLGQPHTLTIPAEFSQCCRGFPEPDRIGDVHGDGGFIAFGSQVRCNDRDAPACVPPTAPRTLLSQSVWRLRRPPFQAQCVNKQGPCVLLATKNDVLQPLSVDTGRVVLRRANAVLEVRKPGGALVRVFPQLAGRTRAAELMGGRLVVLVPGRVLDFSISTGARLHRRQVPNVPSAGVCGIPPCPQADLRLVDASRGLVAYLHAGDLHLLRLRDGQDQVVAPATDARFGDTGLFYAFAGAAPWPARIRFVPWVSLPLQP